MCSLIFSWWVFNINLRNSFDTFQAITSVDDSSTFTSRAARRLYRTRQHLGTYRHDLLVAMRVVNSIEKEVIQAEWEDWVSGENNRCTQMGKMMADGNVTQVQEMAETKQRFDLYCASCREAQIQVSAQSKSRR